MEKRWSSLWGEPASKTQPSQPLEEGPWIDKNPIIIVISSQITLITIAYNADSADSFMHDLIIPIWRRRRNVHSFSEELALLTSAVIYNLVYSSFTFLASKVGGGQSMETLIENKILLRCQNGSRLDLSSMESIWSTSLTRCCCSS